MSTPVERSSYREIAPRPIDTIAAEAVAAVDFSIQRFAEWGIRLPSDSRLHQAREILAHAVATRELVPKHRGDDLGLRALELAFDYKAIAASLPPTVIASMKPDLRDSLRGPLNPSPKKRNSVQLQSQALVRAALVLAGQQPRYPSRSSTKGIKSPDLLLDCGTVSYSIEVKRPQERHNVLRNVEKAVDQIREYGLSGAVLIDATDALRNEAGAGLMNATWQIIDEVTNLVFVAGEGYKSGMSHIMLVGAIARVAWHSEDGENSAMVQVHSTSGFRVLAKAPNTLADRRAKWMRTVLRTGFEGLDQAIDRREIPPTSS